MLRSNRSTHGVRDNQEGSAQDSLSDSLSRSIRTRCDRCETTHHPGAAVALDTNVGLCNKVLQLTTFSSIRQAVGVVLEDIIQLCTLVVD